MKKLPGGGRPLSDKDFDDNLAAWVREQRSRKLGVSREIIKLQARKSFHPENGIVFEV
jgi:hypothetical protein